MTHPAATLRELGAEARTFPGPQAVLLWYVVQLSRRSARGADLDGGGCARPNSERDRTSATFAKIAGCLVPRHEADEERDEPLAFATSPETARAEARRRVGLLARWYVSSSENGRARLSDELDMTPQSCERYVRYAERVLRRRFVAVGLIKEET